MFGPPIDSSMVYICLVSGKCCWCLYLKKGKRGKDVEAIWKMWNGADKKNIQDKSVQTNSNLYFNNTCN